MGFAFNFCLWLLEVPEEAVIYLEGICIPVFAYPVLKSYNEDFQL